MSPEASRRVTVENLPLAVAAALQADVAAGEVSMSDAVRRVLASRYQLAAPVDVRRRQQWAPPSARLLLKLPEPMWHRLKVEAAESKRTMRAVIVEALADHYEVEVTP